MKKILSILLFMFLMFGGFNYVNASNQNKINNIMNNFYSKLDKSILDIEKKINKLEFISSKIKFIKKNKWNKLSSNSKDLLNGIELNINNKILFYKKELENQIKVETNFMSSGYCNGGKIFFKGKEIFKDKKNCVLDYKVVEDNLNISICYGDGGGSGECVFIDMIYYSSNKSWTFSTRGGYYSPESIERYELNINDKQLINFKKNFRKNYKVN